MLEKLEKYRDELLKTAGALKTVEVRGEHWLTMVAAVNSIMMAVSGLQEEIDRRTGEDHAIDNTT